MNHDDEIRRLQERVGRLEQMIKVLSGTPYRYGQVSRGVEIAESGPKPEPSLEAKLWAAWSRAAHGGLPAGSPPRAQLHDCLAVLTARGAGVERFEAVAKAWAAGRRAKGKLPQFGFFASELAALLDSGTADGSPKPAKRKPLTPAHIVLEPPPDFDGGRR